MVISCGALFFYSLAGGIKTSIYTDLLQGGMMILAGVLMFIISTSVISGGFTGVVDIILRDDPQAMSPWGTLGIIGCVSWYFLFVVGSLGQPHILTKAMMIKELPRYRYVPIMSVMGYTLTALLWIGVGLSMRALVLGGFHSELIEADTTVTVFLMEYTHPVLAGVVFAGLFAAIMSSADSFLNIGSATLANDIPKALGYTVSDSLFFLGLQHLDWPSGQLCLHCTIVRMTNS